MRQFAHRSKAVGPRRIAPAEELHDRIARQGRLGAEADRVRQGVAHGDPEQPLVDTPRDGRNREQIVDDAEIEQRMSDFDREGRHARIVALEQRGPLGQAQHLDRVRAPGVGRRVVAMLRPSRPQLLLVHEGWVEPPRKGGCGVEDARVLAEQPASQRGADPDPRQLPLRADVAAQVQGHTAEPPGREERPEVSPGALAQEGIAVPARERDPAVGRHSPELVDVDGQERDVDRLGSAQLELVPSSVEAVAVGEQVRDRNAERRGRRRRVAALLIGDQVLVHGGEGAEVDRLGRRRQERARRGRHRRGVESAAHEDPDALAPQPIRDGAAQELAEPLDVVAGPPIPEQEWGDRPPSMRSLPNPQPVLRSCQEILQGR